MLYEGLHESRVFYWMLLALNQVIKFAPSCLQEQDRPL